jgi:uncharacterized protein
MIRIEFDPAKDAKNRQKHGFSLEIGGIVIESAVDVEMDEHEGETRWRAYGWFEGRPMICVYTMREPDLHRIISVRQATKHEVKAWFEW